MDINSFFFNDIVTWILKGLMGAIILGKLVCIIYGITIFYAFLRAENPDPSEPRCSSTITNFLIPYFSSIVYIVL
jgi:hypothetical protein